MPTDTFFNLPEEKRELITRIAMEEFALYDYKTASITRIIEKAGISKGSIYQYFENKKTLYLYIIKLAADTKLNYISNHLNQEITDFFSMIKEMNLLSIHFDFTYPAYSGVIVNSMSETYSEEFGDLAEKMLRQSDKYIVNFIEQARDSGQVRDDIELELVAFFVSRLSVYTTDYLSLKYGFAYRDLIRQREKKFPISRENLERELDRFLELIKSGIKKKAAK